MKVAKELREWDWRNGLPGLTYPPLGLSDGAYQTLNSIRLDRGRACGWQAYPAEERAEMMSEAIEAAEALGL